MSSNELIFNFRENKHYYNEFLGLIKKSNKFNNVSDSLIKGFVEDSYVPFALINEKGDMLAGLIVIKFNFFIDDNKYNAVQICQAIVKDGCEGLDADKELLGLVTAKYQNLVDIIYTYNEDFAKQLVDKFGFQEVIEYNYYKDWEPSKSPVGSVIKKMDLDNIKDLELIRAEIKHSTRMSSVFATNGDSQLKIFNLLKFYKKNVYYLPSIETVVIFKIIGNIFRVVGVYSKNNVDIDNMLESIVPEGIEKIEFGFVPNVVGLKTEPFNYEDEDLASKSKLVIKSISAPLKLDNLLVPLLAKGN